MLALIGIIMMLESIGFIFFAVEITEIMFPFSKNNPEALSLGISLRYAMASGVFFLGMYKRQIIYALHVILVILSFYVSSRKFQE